MPTRRPIATCTEVAGEIFTLRRAPDAEVLGEDERRALLAEVRGNAASTAELVIEARTYLQGGKPNANHIRVRDGALQATARSFINRPFLRDHNARDLMARGGTVVDSKLERDEAGIASFRQTIRLVKPWAIEAALDGTLDRFSVGFKPTGPITCTVCNASFVRGFFGIMPGCDHEMGQEYEVRGGAKRLAEAEFSSADGVEVSGVSVPAVQGTGIDGIRAALADGELSDLFAQETTNMLQNIARALGLTLAAGADPEPAILAEIERRSALFDAERSARAQAELHLAAHREQLMQGRRDAVVERALREGKCKPTGELHDRIVKLAAIDVESAEKFVAEMAMQSVTPVGAKLVSTETPPADPPAAVLSDTDVEVARQLGMPAEKMRAAKAKTANGRG